MNAQTTAKQTSKMSQIGKTRYMVQVAMLGAAAVVLMFFDIPLPFAPSFYKIDLSEVPVLIGAFAMGPLAGAAIEPLECRWMPLWEWDPQSTKQLQAFRPLFCLPLYRLISSKVLWYHW